ncbi:DUF3179 domain-containing protein [Nitrospiraceae bacterium AH_259_D15_M11_P09]|nr:DUF3179 domain-containing protein [Nitrospiraceae bacterium AH_259_D15_M11_P09]
MKHIFLVHTSWGEWQAAHPTTLVLSTNTGHLRNYERDPYAGYARRRDLMFDVRHLDPTYYPKEWILGLEVDGAFKAYPFVELQKLHKPLADRVNGQKVLIHFNPQAQSAFATDADGKPMPSVTAFWFAWYAFHPDTQVLKVSE